MPCDVPCIMQCLTLVTGVPLRCLLSVRSTNLTAPDCVGVEIKHDHTYELAFLDQLAIHGRPHLPSNIN